MDDLVDPNNDIAAVKEDNLRDDANNLTTFEKTVEPISTDLANIVKNVLVNSINKEKLIKKLEKHPRRENLKILKVKNCNPEI